MSQASDSPAVGNVLTVAIEHEPFGEDQTVAGAPTSGWLPLTSIGAFDVGVWEMTPGTISDVEADEVFCVLAGRAVVEFLDPPAASIELAPGTLVRLQAGWQTRWTVTETLRKIAIG